MKSRLTRTAAGTVAALALTVLFGCGAGGARSSRVTAGRASADRPAFGITEDNAALLWRPGSALADGAQHEGASLTAAPAGARVRLAREELTALHPRYLRLLIDWAALQPRADRPPELEATVDGCARSSEPCVPYAGVREQFAAIASQQRAAPGYFQIVLDIFGTPAWAARAPAGCERGARGAFSRAPSAAGLAGYRALIGALVALGASEGVALDWWAPWNEPNDPTFLSPQRAYCTAASSTLSASAYAELARAMAAQLRAAGGERHLLLGELNAYSSSGADRLDPAQFIAALPADVLCLSQAWSVHAYAGRGPFASARDPVGVLEQALQMRGGCAPPKPIWVTEAGAGAPHPGDSWKSTQGEERAGCTELARQLLGWGEDPRVGAVFQYSFREDPSFPVGLIDAKLLHTYSAYRVWLAWSRARGAGSRATAVASACG